MKHSGKPGVRFRASQRKMVIHVVKTELSEREDELQKQREVDLAWEEHHRSQ